MDNKQWPQASSATTGFFQRLPVVQPAYSSSTQQSRQQDLDAEDDILSNILGLYLPDPLPPAVDRSLHSFARTCLDSDTLRLTVDCENNPPTLHPLTTFGEQNNVNPLRTSEGWKRLKDIQTRAGIVAHGYRSTTGGVLSADKSYNVRVHQFALQFLWSGSSASVSCPAAMTDGAAILLAKHLARKPITFPPEQDPAALRRVLEEAYARLTSFDPSYAWTSGQWMTERPGGSDVSRTETLARLTSKEDLEADMAAHGGSGTDAVGMALGPYLVDGFKWFSSATDADMVVLLAQTRKGLSAFYAPMRRAVQGPKGRESSVMNGIRISRLKNKLGTKGLPTAELEIKGMRAWLLGEEGRGVREISAILNATRLWTATGAVGGWNRGLSIAKAYSKVRMIKGDHLLVNNRQHVKWLATETVKFRACAHFAYLGVALLGISEIGQEAATRNTRAQRWLPRDSHEAGLLLRILTPVMKAQCSLWSTLGLREAMESLGGVGYCENQEDDGVLNIARIYRDSNVNSIWEGTTNILAEDFVRSIKGAVGAEAIAVLGRMVDQMLSLVTGFSEQITTVRHAWSILHKQIQIGKSEDLLYHGRELLRTTQNIVCGCLLMLDAIQSGTRERIVAERWVAMRFAVGGHSGEQPVENLQEEAEKDRIVLLGRSNRQTIAIVPHKL